MQTNTKKLVYAGFFVRLAAYLMDWCIVGIGLLAVRVPFFIASISNSEGLLVKDMIFQYSIADMVLYLLTACYFILTTYFTGGTIGKHAMSLRVIRVKDEKEKEQADITEEEEDLYARPSFFEVVYRETVGKFLSGVIMSLGYLMIFIQKDKRGLHDILADTAVVYYHEKRAYLSTPVVYRDMHASYVTPSSNRPNPASANQENQFVSPVNEENEQKEEQDRLE